MPLGQVWAREHYDWSEPETARWTVVESNFCTPSSYVSARLRPREQGGTRIEIHWQRTGSSLMGRVVCGMIAATNGKPVASSLKKPLRKLEATNSTHAPGSPSNPRAFPCRLAPRATWPPPCIAAIRHRHRKPNRRARRHGYDDIKLSLSATATIEGRY